MNDICTPARNGMSEQYNGGTFLTYAGEDRKDALWDELDATAENGLFVISSEFTAEHVVRIVNEIVEEFGKVTFCTDYDGDYGFADDGKLAKIINTAVENLIDAVRNGTAKENQLHDEIDNALADLVMAEED